MEIARGGFGVELACMQAASVPVTYSCDSAAGVDRSTTASSTEVEIYI